MKRAGILLALIGVVACGLALPTLGKQTQKPMTQHQMNQEAAAAFKGADARLNAAYKKLMAKLSKSRQTKLKTAQIAWLKFRDAESAFFGSEMEGGSAEPMLHSGAMAELTEERAKALNETYKNLMSR